MLEADVKERRRIYYLTNKDKIRKQQKEWYVNNGEKIAQYRTKNSNRDKEVRAQWYIKNKDKVASYDLEKIRNLVERLEVKKYETK